MHHASCIISNLRARGVEAFFIGWVGGGGGAGGNRELGVGMGRSKRGGGDAGGSSLETLLAMVAAVSHYDASVAVEDNAATKFTAEPVSSDGAHHSQ